MDSIQRLRLGDLPHFAPELTLVIGFVVLILLDLFLPKKASRIALGWLSLLSIAIAIVFTALQLDKAPVQLLNDSFRLDDFAVLFKLVVLGATGLILFMTIGTVDREEITHSGEFYYLFLPAVLGAMIMASSGDLITLYVGLELLSITTYIMVGMKKHNRLSNEASFKYLVSGAIASAILLYGMSFLYGLSGSTNLGVIHTAITKEPSFDALVYVSFFLILAGFGFKVAAAPFHTWAPDVYQGAPTPVTAFLAVVSKAGGFAVLYRMLFSVYFQLDSSNGGSPALEKDLFLAVMVVAAIAMIVGNTLALRQTSLKRLFAASGIANAGYLLVPLGIVRINMMHYSNFSEFFYYMIAYAFMTIGAFAVVMIVNVNVGHDDVKGLAGMYYRAPLTAVAMTVLVLSFTGLPITGGFFGKLFILIGTLQVREYWLAAVIMAASVVSFYYYFGIVRQMFMRTASEDSRFRIPPNLGITLWICTIATVLLGLFPGFILRYVNDILSLVQDFIIHQG